MLPQHRKSRRDSAALLAGVLAQSTDSDNKTGDGQQVGHDAVQHPDHFGQGAVGDQLIGDSDVVTGRGEILAHVELLEKYFRSVDLAFAPFCGRVRRGRRAPSFIANAIAPPYRNLLNSANAHSSKNIGKSRLDIIASARLISFAEEMKTKFPKAEMLRGTFRMPQPPT